MPPVCAPIRSAIVNEQTKFFMYLLECYAYEKGRPTGDVLREWDTKGITREILDGYEMYHTERLENAYEDIDSLMASGEHAW